METWSWNTIRQQGRLWEYATSAITHTYEQPYTLWERINFVLSWTTDRFDGDWFNSLHRL